MAYIKTQKVLFESCDGLLTISTSSQHLYISADYGNFIKVLKYPFDTKWESALTWQRLEKAVDIMLGTYYVLELEKRHEEFLDDLISYWEE
jgi:hypothetical protein